jgi:hypothetical protein
MTAAGPFLPTPHLPTNFDQPEFAAKKMLLRLQRQPSVVLPRLRWHHRRFDIADYPDNAFQATDEIGLHIFRLNALGGRLSFLARDPRLCS